MSKRRALVVGINYENNKDATLRGCVNDAAEMNKILTKLGYEVKLLLESDATRRNIMASLLDLRNWTHVEDGNVEIVVHYSGHGSQTVDLSGDETDGLDEVLIPYDFQLAGTISDDWLWNTLHMAHRFSKWFFVIDACHSCTVLDMIQNVNLAKMYSLSGCMDCQTSADASFIMNGHKVYGGALTTAIITCFEVDNTGVRTNAIQLKEWVDKYIKSEGFTQRPQLTSTTTDMSISFFTPI
jgi:hypothetical protein